MTPSIAWMYPFSARISAVVTRMRSTPLKLVLVFVTRRGFPSSDR